MSIPKEDPHYSGINPKRNKQIIWFHVDGAMSGTAAICPEYRYIQEGIDYADSYCFNYRYT